MKQIIARDLALGHRHRKTVSGVNLEISQGEFISIIGPSVVEKSALLLGFNATTAMLEGCLEVLGFNLEDLPAEALNQLRSRIGLIPQCSKLGHSAQILDAMAYASYREPAILLADEPISNLDPVSAYRVMATLSDFNKKNNITVIVNLHHLEFARDFSSRILGLREGKIVFDGTPQELSPFQTRAIYDTPGARGEEEYQDDFEYGQKAIVSG